MPEDRIDTMNRRCPQCHGVLPAGLRPELCPVCALEDSDDLTRRELGDCELWEELGRGGMGVVWRGWQRGLEREVAIKTLPGGDLANSESRRRFRAEAQAMARLSHPGIVSVFDVGEAEGTPYLIMELIRGRTLAERIGGRPLPWRLAARWISEAASAVQHAHENGVLHRDIKPSNILIESSEDGGRPRVSDFGLAKLVDDGGHLTRSRSAMGSPAYMAPETVLRGEFSRQSDVYGLGAVLYSALTGRPPFQAESVASVMYLVEKEDPIPPRSLERSIPMDLETICLACLDKSPGRRYATAAGLAEDLKNLLGGRPVNARPLGPVARTVRSAVRHPWRAAAVGLAACLVGGLGFAAMWKLNAERQHGAELQAEQDSTRRVMLLSQLNEARAIIRLKRADSRKQSEEILARIQAEDRNHEFVAELKDLFLAAAALPLAVIEAVPGDGTIMDDWTLTTGDLPRNRWALAAEGGHVEVRSLISGEKLVAFDTSPRMVTALIGFSPGGRWLAIRHQQELGLWDTSADAPRRLALLARPWDGTNRFDFMKCAVSPDDRSLLWLTRAGIMSAALPEGLPSKQWDAEAGDSHPGEAIAFDPSGKWVGVALANSTVELRSWPMGRRIRVFRGRFPKKLGSLALSHGAEWIAGGDAFGRVTVFRGDGADEPLLEFRGHTSAIRGLAFSGDGPHLVSTSDDGTTRIWDCRSGKGAVHLPFSCGIASASTHGLQIGVGCHQGRVAMIRLDPPRLLNQFQHDYSPPQGQVVSFFPEGKSLVCLGENSLFHCAVPSGAILSKLAYPAPYSVLAADGNEGSVVVAGRDGVSGMRFSDPSFQAVLHPPARFGWGSVVYSGNRQQVGVSDFGGQRMAVWPADARSAGAMRYVAVTNGAGSLALSPDGSLGAVAKRYERGLEIIEMASSRVLRRLDLPAMHDVAWSPDGKWLAANGSSTVGWDTQDWKPASLPVLEGNVQPTSAVAFSQPDPSDGSMWMAAATANHRVALIRFPERTLAARLESPSGHAVYHIEISGDSRWLAVGAASGEVQIWDLAATREILEKRGLGRK